MHMFRNTFLLSVGAIPLLVATASVAEEVPREVDRYSLTFTIRQQDRTIAEPRMKVRAGEQGTMTVEDKSSGKGYQLAVLAKPVVHPTGKSGEWLEVSASFSEIQKGALAHKTQPVLVVPLVVDNALRSQAADAEQASMSLVSSSRAQEMAAQQDSKGSKLQGAGTPEFQMTVSATQAAKKSAGQGQEIQAQGGCEGFGGASETSSVGAAAYGTCCRICPNNPNYYICCTNSCSGEFTICGTYCYP